MRTQHVDPQEPIASTSLSPRRALLARLRDDRPVYLLIAAYGFASFLLSLVLGDGRKFVPLVYVALWLRTGALALLGAALLAIASAAAVGRLASLRSRVLTFATPERLAGSAMLVALLVFHGLFTSTKTMLPDLAPFRHDRALADLDAMLHGGDPWRALLGLNPLTATLQVVYSAGWTVVLLATMAYAALELQGELRRRFLWSFLLCWVLLGNVLAMLGMSAGPVFYQGVVGDPRFIGLTRHLDVAGVGGVIDCRAMLWNAYVHHVAGVGTGISAFPSLHVSMATLIALLLHRIDRRLGAAALAFGLVILVSSIHLGWHYAVDSYAAIAGTLVIWWGAGRLAVRSPSFRAVEIRVGA